MTSEQIIRAGRTLFGEHWHRSFEQEFQMSARTRQRLVAGTAEIWPELSEKIETALRDRSIMMDELMLELV